MRAASPACSRGMRALISIAVVGAFAGGCMRLPAEGVPTFLSHSLRERDTGPIVAVFGGFQTSCKDPANGMTELARLVAERMEGSVAVFSWRGLRRAVTWCRQEGAKRVANGEVAEFGISGHSWGGHSACKLVRRVLDDFDGDARVAALVTLDAVHHGYCRQAFATWLACATFACVSSQRHGFMALRYAPEPGRPELRYHVNYYQRDSACFHGGHMWTATENHLEWRDAGDETDHGNVDGMLAEAIAEDLRRSFDPKWSRP
jgi:hypothetical protein